MNEHHRHAMRYRGFDYGAGWAYFVTQCVERRQPILGRVKNEIAYLLPCGLMVQEALLKAPGIYGVELDAFIIMPDHFHAIFRLNASDNARSLFDVMRRLKTFTTTQYRQRAASGDWPYLEKGLWQRSYYDRILRNEAEWQAACRYIAQNPARWQAKQNEDS